MMALLYCCAISLMLLTTVNAFCQDKTNVIKGETAEVTFDIMDVYLPGNKTMKQVQATGYTPDSCAHYWINIAFDVPANTQAKVKLLGTPDLLVIRRTSTYTGIDTMSNAAIVRATFGTPKDFGMYTGFAAAAPSGIIQNYMSGYNLDVLMQPLVAFSVASRRAQTTNGLVTFDRVMTDTCGAWNTLDQSFTAPQSGLYFLRYGVGTTVATDRNVTLNINGKPDPKQILDGPKSKVASITGGAGSLGIDMVGRCHLTSLDKGDVVTLTFEGDRPYSDADNQLTSFAGFFYRPVSGVQVAWSVSRTGAETNFRLIQAVTFDRVEINVGGAWQTKKNGDGFEAVISVAGSYYLYLDVASCATGAIQADVRINDKTIFSVNYDVNGPLGRSRGSGANVHALIGDKITVWTDKGTCIYGGSSGLTTFSGMLIQPCGMLAAMAGKPFNAAFTF